MTTHEIRMEQSVRDLGKVDVVLQVVIDGAKRGELHISKGHRLVAPELQEAQAPMDVEQAR